MMTGPGDGWQVVTSIILCNFHFKISTVLIGRNMSLERAGKTLSQGLKGGLKFFLQPLGLAGWKLHTNHCGPAILETSS